MNKNILVALTGYILGIIMGLYFKIGIALLILFWIIIVIQKKRRVQATIFLVIVLLSYSYISFTEYRYNNRYKNITAMEAYGKVVSDINKGEYYNSYRFQIIYVKENKNINGTRVLVQIDKNKEEYQYGDIIKIKGQFNIASIQRNYQGFDYREYLKTQKSYGIIEVTKSEKIGKNISANSIMSLLRNNIIERIHNIDNSESAEILIGILLGTTENISEETIEDFKNSGLSHLMAVSGLNVSYVVIGVMFLLQRLKTGKRLAYIVSIIGIMLFMVITNFTDSVTRAGIMAIIIILAKIMYRQPDILSSICFSCLIILIENPYKLFSVGLQLSYAGTIGIVYFYNKFKSKIDLKKKLIHKILDIVLVCIAAQIVVLPLLILHFNTIPVYFLIANVVVSPLIPIIMLLGFIYISISYIFTKISLLIYVPLSITLKLLIFLNKTIANLPFSIILVKTPYIFNTVVAYIVLFAYKKNIKKCISVLLIIVFAVTIIIDYPKNFVLHFVDVGQGDCTFIVTEKGKTVLIDGGGSEFGTFDVGKNILLPYLLDRKINTIDYMVISHFDSDHCIGLFEIIKRINVKNIIIPKQFEVSENYIYFINIAKHKNVKIVSANDTIYIDKYTRIEVLWPIDKYIANNVLNNNSLVLKLIYKDVSILFTGDIEEEAEREIATLYKNSNVLNSNILKVSHHGSKTSTTLNFLELVKPSIALIGVKKGNKFGHPNSDVIERLKEFNIKIYRTDEMGEVSLIIKKHSSIKIATQIE